MRTATIILLAALIAAPFVSPARADDLAAARATIQSQIEAFLAGDDEAAYSHAAPNIRRIHPSQDGFMRMVRQGYAPVHRPQSHGFGQGEIVGPGSVMQRVLLVGPDGRDYEALYTLELQPDGRYRIAGVHLRESETLGS